LKKLIIVESPTKVHTISKFLGKDYIVKASMGHIIDLPKSRIGIEVENNFEPKYIVMRDKAKILKDIKEAAEKTDVIYLATDPDREGEAISWHLRNAILEEKKSKSKKKQPAKPKVVKEKKTYRVVFNEITKKAVMSAIENPRDLDMNLVYAQQARRIMDRLVGYMISPLLWKNVQSGLSAGRVQSVALRMICEREKEITAFKPEEYWSIEALLKGENPPQFTAKLTQINGEKFKVVTKEEGDKIVAECKKHPFIVKKVESKEKNRYAPAPFITSTLQQEASKKLGFTSRKTMMIAQQLYEGLNVGEEAEVGLITYMRTDSVRIAEEALAEVRGLIGEKYGQENLPEKPNFYKNKKNSQDAHEAIRPSSCLREPEKIKQFLSRDQYRLYDLIWKRFVACQMKPAILEVTTADIAADIYNFRASGTVIKFKGFLGVYSFEEDEEKEEKSEAGADGEEKEAPKEKILPKLSEQEKLELLELTGNQHFTEPPARYNDASLVKALEENNIGRPSTYSPIISTLLDRNYVERLEKRFKPTELGELVDDILIKTFPDILNIEFTANMEGELDKVEDGEIDWVSVIKEFYGPFSEDLLKASNIMGGMKKDRDGETGQICDALYKKNAEGILERIVDTTRLTEEEKKELIPCGRNMVVKWGARGRFLACTGFPICKNTKSIDGEEQKEEITNMMCEARYLKTDAGLVRVTKKAPVPEGQEGNVIDCGGRMVTKFSRFGKFMACEKYPECKNTKSIGIGIKCPKPDCGGDVIMRKGKKGTFFGCSNYPDCDFISNLKPIDRKCPKCGYAVMAKFKDNFRCLNKECKHEEENAAAN